MWASALLRSHATATSKAAMRAMAAWTGELTNDTIERLPIYWAPIRIRARAPFGRAGSYHFSQVPVLPSHTAVMIPISFLR